MKGPLEVLEDLLRIESPSGREEGVVAYLHDLLERAGARPIVQGRNIWAVRGTDDGPTLLLNSHTDTVPATSAWTRPPFGAVTEDGKLYGLGVSDAKSCVVGLLWAFLEAKVPRGRLIFSATCEEEIGGQGLEVVVPQLPAVDAAIVGEPTGMEPCVGQRGRVLIECTAVGRAGHASRPWQGDNAIYRAARAIAGIERLELAPENALLGRATVCVSLISGGTRSNVIPPECSFTIDGRSTPEVSNVALVEQVKAAASAGGADAIRVNVKSSRYVPVQTAESEVLVQAALAASPGSAVRAFGGISDLFHVRHCPGIILGPGSPPQSHQADEHIERSAVERGVEVYRRTVEEYFARRAGTREL